MRVLIVSPHFPPVNAPDLQRIRASLPTWVAAGWDVTVLTVDDPTPSAPVEPELLATIPSAVKVVRATCCSRRWTAQLGVNNVALRSLPFLFVTGWQLLSSRRFDVVYFSTTMFITLPLGRLWRALTGVPYVIDLQDPWVTDFYRRPGAPPPPGGWKYAWSERVARGLEGWTLRRAAHVISVSPAYLDDLRQRHPALRRMRGTVIPFGAAAADLAHVAKRRATQPRLLPANGLNLAFAGAVGPGMLPAVHVFLAGLAQARAAGGALSAHFFGTSYSPAAASAPLVLAEAAQLGLADAVQEQPTRLTYFDALQVTLEADVNLLFGSTDLGFVPSKLALTLAAGRPVLAIAPTCSALAARLAEAGQRCVTFASDETTAIAAATVAQLLRDLATPAARTAAASQCPAEWSADFLAARQGDILHAAASASPA